MNYIIPIILTLIFGFAAFIRIRDELRYRVEDAHDWATRRRILRDERITRQMNLEQLKWLESLENPTDIQKEYIKKLTPF